MIETLSFLGYMEQIFTILSTIMYFKLAKDKLEAIIESKVVDNPKVQSKIVSSSGR